jgi:hypothetical protein
MSEDAFGGGDDGNVGQAWLPSHLLKPSLLKYSRTSVLSSTFCMRREVAAEGAEERWMAAARLPARSEGIPVGAKHSAAPAIARRTVPRMSIFKNKTRIAFTIASYGIDSNTKNSKKFRIQESRNLIAFFQPTIGKSWWVLRRGFAPGWTQMHVFDLLCAALLAARCRAS